jgi:hypothetical protein
MRMARVVKFKEVRVTPNRVDDNNIMSSLSVLNSVLRKNLSHRSTRANNGKKELSRIDTVNRTCQLGNSISEE